MIFTIILCVALVVASLAIGSFIVNGWNDFKIIRTKRKGRRK